MFLLRAYRPGLTAVIQHKCMHFCKAPASTKIKVLGFLIFTLSFKILSILEAPIGVFQRCTNVFFFCQDFQIELDRFVKLNLIKHRSHLHWWEKQCGLEQQDRADLNIRWRPSSVATTLLLRTLQIPSPASVQTSLHWSTCQQIFPVKAHVKTTLSPLTFWRVTKRSNLSLTISDW